MSAVFHAVTSWAIYNLHKTCTPGRKPKNHSSSAWRPDWNYVNPITQIQNILNTQNLTQISRNFLCKSLAFLYLPNCINSLCDKFIQYYAINVGFQFFFHWWHNGHCHWFDEYSLYLYQVLDSCALISLNRHLFLVEKEWYVHTKYTCVHTYRSPPDINHFFQSWQRASKSSVLSNPCTLCYHDMLAIFSIGGFNLLSDLSMLWSI